MKYGESTFDIVYLLIVIIIGIKIIINNQNNQTKLMGYSILILGCGDAFHLIPRVLNYFIDNNFNLLLGIGKLVTSIKMTIFYIIMYYIYIKNYNQKENKKITFIIWSLLVLRIILCLLPQNGWFTNESPYICGIIRNIPFAIIGSIIVLLFYKERSKDKIFKNIWLLVLLSFIFYFIVVSGAPYITLLGMFMIPKTICYILIVFLFYNKSKEIH